MAAGNWLDVSTISRDVRNIVIDGELAVALELKTARSHSGAEGIASDGLLKRKHLKRRVFRGDGADLIVARVRPGALEEDPDLGLPPLEVGAQDRYFLVVGELSASEALGTLAQPQFAGAGDPQGAHPLGFAAGGDQGTAERK